MFNPNLKSIRCMLEVARLESFTRAADNLNMTQPSLSIQISQLEKNLGFQLFERSTRYVRLTKEGEYLRDYAQRLVEESDRFINAAERTVREVSNQLRIGAALYTHAISERHHLIEEFLEAYPCVDLKVDAHTQLEILNGLLSDNLDLAIMIGLAVEPEVMNSVGRAELIIPSDLIRQTIREERIDLLVPNESPLAEYDELPLAALRGTKVLVPSKEHGAVIIEPILKLLRSCDVEICTAPEATATATERYGAKQRIPAITFGWFEVSPSWNVSRKSMEGLDTRLQLSILGRQTSDKASVNRFLGFARRRYPDIATAGQVSA